MDEKSTKIVSAALTMYDIMEHRVTLVELLSKSRQPFPEMDVVYFVSPTKGSVEKMGEDFLTAEKAKYGNVHLFFTDTVRSFSHIMYTHLFSDRINNDSGSISFRMHIDMNLNFLEPSDTSRCDAFTSKECITRE